MRSCNVPQYRYDALPLQPGQKSGWESIIKLFCFVLLTPPAFPCLVGFNAQPAHEVAEMEMCDGTSL
jgi:hypothetical protein